MAIYDYHDLDVYTDGFELAIQVHEETEKFPEDERFGLVSQLRGSSKSVCANIAEGFGRKTDECRRYLRMAHGSIQETKVWIEFSQKLGYLEADKARRYWKEYDELARQV